MTNVEALHLALCADEYVLPGLHVTLYTALLHLPRNTHAEIYVFTNSLTDSDINLLNRTLQRTGRSFSLTQRTINLSAFRQLPWQGGWMTYGRLVIPLSLQTKRVIYLDADLIVHADLSEIWTADMAGAALGAASWGTMAQSNDHAFFTDLGVDTSAPYFNAGVLLIDCDVWRTTNVTQRCFDFAFQHSGRLPSMDQTILNYVFYNSFAQLPRRFNTPVTASRRPLKLADVANRVIHLVAYPKPWDGLGMLNGQYHLFHSWLRRTEWQGRSNAVLQWRTLRKIRAILKCLPNLFRNIMPHSWDTLCAKENTGD